MPFNIINNLQTAFLSISSMLYAHIKTTKLAFGFEILAAKILYKKGAQKTTLMKLTLDLR
jgi:hypothetical protein